MKARLERFVRDFEWTWTRAFMASLGVLIFLVVFEGIIPSFWMYFSSQKLLWTDGFKQKLADLVVTGETGTSLIVFMVVVVLLQNWRRRLRSGEHMSSNGYR
jgi:membrane protein implicated in regulation of membrane protease activity